MTTAPEFDQTVLDKLFPPPSFASAFTSPSAPTPNPGITPESTAALQRLLKENHQRFHIFYDHKRFNNHITNHLFAAYSIGAPPCVLQAAFDGHAWYQRPAYKSPSPITRENWTKHLGDEDYFNAYMGFFNTELERQGLARTLEQYIFSYEANWGPGEPQMLDRFLSGVLHALIHVGHAAEFGVPGMAVEGLVYAVANRITNRRLFDAKFFNSSSRFALLSFAFGTNKPKEHTHAFTILARVLADPRLEAGKTTTFESDTKFDDTMESAGEIIREYAELWTVKENDQVIQARIEELQWLVTLMFGLDGWKEGHEFKADFFLVHLVTSNLFIPSIVPLLQPASQTALLRRYFAVCLTYFVARGRPALDVAGFFRHTSIDPHPSDSIKSNPTEAQNNPWYTILEYTMPHEDEHHVKAERALAHGAALYGRRPKGWFKDTELKDAELIDGSLFIRTGGLLMIAVERPTVVEQRNQARVKRDPEDDVEAGWDRAGLGWDQAWSGGEALVV